MNKSSTEWTNPQKSLSYLKAVETFLYRKEGDTVLLQNIPANATRILDIGSGDGRLIKMIKENNNRSDIEFVVLDISPVMLKSLKDNFGNDASVKVIEHDIDNSLPDLGYFDAIISSFGI